MDNGLASIIDEDTVNDFAVRILQSVLDYGKRNDKSGWKYEYPSVHIQHEIDHINNMLDIVAETRGEINSTQKNIDGIRENLYHAFCRLMMACITFELRIEEEYPWNGAEYTNPWGFSYPDNT